MSDIILDMLCYFDENKLQAVFVLVSSTKGMAIFGLSSRSVALIGFGLFVAFYLDNSPPVISTDLSDWINKGKYMVFNRQKIFYRGKIFCNFDNFLLLNTNFTEFHHHMRFDVISEDRGLSRSRSTVICLHGFPTFSFDWTKVVYLSSSAFLKDVK